MLFMDVTCTIPIGIGQPKRFKMRFVAVILVALAPLLSITI
ncbi:MAG: hypothetical protein U1A24_13345 [Cypionkella sp.]|nr:hypothetical protein [Cypionkella sp.]